MVERRGGDVVHVAHGVIRVRGEDLPARLGDLHASLLAVLEQLEEVNKMASLLTLVRRAGPDGLHWVEDYLSRKNAEA